MSSKAYVLADRLRVAPVAVQPLELRLVVVEPAVD